ncbi:MAG: hypothetical protein LBF68_01420 [Christensenellaceae bacterium]|jgi:hypothetical protein|nr:hypothetical protein [Christensenellaceae bacterium]
MAKKNKKRSNELIAENANNSNVPPRFSASFKTINNCGPVPVAKPADFIQLTPIVQTIVDVHVIQYEDSEE